MTKSKRGGEMINIIGERIEEIGMSTNQLSRLSGVKNNHLKQIQNRTTKKPGKDILIRIGLALSFGIDGINRLLKEYGKEELSEADLTFFVEAIKRRDIRTGYNAIHPGGFNFEITIMSVERIRGDIKLVTPIPHIVFRDFEEYFLSDQVPLKEKNESVYKEIRKFLFKQRIEAFKNTLKEHKITHLICRDCLEDDIRGKKKKQPTDVIVEEYNRIFNGLRNENYNLRLVSKCPGFKFHISGCEKNKKPVVVFAGNPKHPSTPSFEEGDDGARIGFVSDSKQLYDYFSKEFERLRRFSLDQCFDNEKLIKYLIDLLKKNGIDGKWKN